MLVGKLAWRCGRFGLFAALIFGCKTPETNTSEVESTLSPNAAVPGLGVEHPSPDEATYIKQLQDLTLVVMNTNRQREGSRKITSHRPLKGGQPQGAITRVNPGAKGEVNQAAKRGVNSGANAQ